MQKHIQRGLQAMSPLLILNVLFFTGFDDVEALVSPPLNVKHPIKIEGISIVISEKI